MEQLIEVAKAVFHVKPIVYTNEGLTRKELRKLQFKGLVVSELTSGRPIRRIWRAKEELWKT